MKSIFLLLTLALAAPAQDAPVLKTSGAFFALSVADAKASAKWYADKFGLKVTMEAPKQGGASAIALEGGGLIVELIERDDAQPLSKAAAGLTDPMGVHGIVKVGVVIEDFDKTLATLKSRGVQVAFGPYPARGNQRANAILKDNSGNMIQLFGK